MTFDTILPYLKKINKKSLLDIFAAGAVGVARVVNNSINIILTFLVVRIFAFDTQTIGQLTYILTALTIITLISDFGFGEVLQKFVNKMDPKKAISPAIFWKIIITLLFSLMVVLIEKISGFFLLENNLNLALFCLAIIGSTYNVIILLFNALEKPIRSVAYQFLYFGVTLVILFSSINIFQTPQITGTLLAIAGGWILTLIIMIVDLFLQKLLEFHIKLPKGFLGFCLVNFSLIAAIMYYTQTDSFYIVNYYGGEQGEYLNGVYKPIAFMGFLPKIFGIILATPLFPIWSRLFDKKDFKKLFKITNYSLLFLFLSGVSLFSLAFFFAQPFLDLVYANPDITENGKWTLPVIVGAFGLHSINYNLAFFMEAVEKKRLVFVVSFLQVLVFTASIMSLIGFGVIYVALSALLVELVGILFYGYNYLKIKSDFVAKK